MDNSEKAKHIIDIIRRYASDATVRYINASANMARAEMGHALWEKENKGEIGCFCRDPYNVKWEKEQMDRAQKEKSAREEVLEYAIDIFLDKIETKPIA